MPSVNDISPSQLMRLLGIADCPPIIDVRIDADLQIKSHLMPGAGPAHYVALFRWARVGFSQGHDRPEART